MKGHSDTVRFYLDNVRKEVLSEATELKATKPTSSTSEIMTAAMANVAARTIQTEEVNPCPSVKLIAASAN